MTVFLHGLALEPTATAPLFGSLQQIHACSYSRRGSTLDHYTTFSLRLHYFVEAGKEGHGEAIPLELT
jgi:hypothetical protein